MAAASVSCIAAAPASAQSQAPREIDIAPYFANAAKTRGAGLARKTKPVDVRPAKPGEVVVTVIKGEGKETTSPPAKNGDKVVRNHCAATGNEEILVAAAKFAERYQGPTGKSASRGWRAYRPRGVTMNYIVVGADDGVFTFKAPWGEQMIARPGDIIVQDRKNARDIYRIARAAFDCTYQIVRSPRPR